MAKIPLFFLAMIFLLLGGCRANEAPKASQSSFRAIIVSDLHFTTHDQSASAIPLMRINVEATKTFLDQVIDMRPDALLITGDNTNSGFKEDEEALAQLLQKVKDAGIAIVMTTGNHDMDHGDAKQYKQIFFSLLEADEVDEASLSYATIIGDVMLLAMDDNSDDRMVARFSRETMDWLERIMDKYPEKRKIFLSHRSVLKISDSDRYQIDNPQLLRMLKKRGVRLCFSGHTHSQAHLQDGSLHEIVSAIPWSGAHLFGVLEIADGHVSYATQSIDFDKHGSADMAQEVHRLDEEADQAMRAMFANVLEGELAQEGVELVMRFFTAYSNGSIALAQDEILSDPCYGAVMEKLQDTNYGPWMKSLVETRQLRADVLEFDE